MIEYTVTVKVPNGGKCKGCDYLNTQLADFISDMGMYCSLWNVSLMHNNNILAVEVQKCEQCLKKGGFK